MPKGHTDLKLATAQRTTIPNVPFRTAMFDASGNMTRTWILFFEQLGGAFTQILNGGGAGLWGGVNVQLASYAAQATDDGLLIVFATTAAATFQLPSKPPATTWKVFVQNAGTAAVTLLPNGAPLLDGAVPGGALQPGQGVYITTDGTNYFTERGLVPAFETNGTPNATQGLLNLVAGTNVTLTDDGAGDVTIAASGGGGTGSGGVNKQTASYTAVSGDDGKLISFSSASATALTFTLPATPPSATWSVHVENAGIHSSATVPGELTITPGSVLSLDGAVAGTLACAVGQGVYITTDGTNYFSERGGPLPTTVINADTGSVALLTLIKSDNGGGSTLAVSSADTSAVILSVTAAPVGGSFTGAAVVVDGNSGDGIRVTNLGGGLGGVPLRAGSGNGIALVAGNAAGASPAASFVNAGIAGSFGPDVLVGAYIAFGGVTVANLGHYVYAQGEIAYCSDAKNVADDLALPGSVAVGGGHGSMVAYINSTWRIMC